MSQKQAKKIRRMTASPELSSHLIGEHNIDDVIAKITRKAKAPTFLVVDLFCGAGGTSTGFEQTNGEAVVIACVNHDHLAIKSHWLNHPHVAHFEEDMRTLDLRPLAKLLAYYRKLYPEAKVILWASLECTNFSKAKGGQPRDADSRTLADHLHRYITALDPDYVQIENVVEFMSWGPLDENGKPVSKKNGADYIRWCNEVKAHGYYDQWKELNSADFGAYTSRNRLFGCFARPGLPIVWPQPTHTKVKIGTKAGGTDLFGPVLQPWMPVREVLDFSDEGKTIFREKPLSEKTLERIYAGLIKYVAGMKQSAFIAKYYSGRPEGKVTSIESPAGTIATAGTQALVRAAFLSKAYGGSPDDKNISVEGPAGTLTCIDHHTLVQPTFLLKYNSMSERGVHIPPSVEEPAPVIAAQHRLGLVQPQFLMQYNGKSIGTDVSEPCNTVPTRDRFQIVQARFLNHYYSSGGQDSSIDTPAPTIPTRDRVAIVSTSSLQSLEQPAGTIMPNDKHRLVECVPFILNPSHGGHSTSADVPCPVIVARQDKAPLYMVQAETGSQVTIAVYEGDSPCTIKIKEFMALYGIVDIKMRMLKVSELLLIQGFPPEYVLSGNQSDQKKFIGNSVHPKVPKAWAEVMAAKIKEMRQFQRVA